MHQFLRYLVGYAFFFSFFLKTPQNTTKGPAFLVHKSITLQSPQKGIPIPHSDLTQQGVVS